MFPKDVMREEGFIEEKMVAAGINIYARWVAENCKDGYDLKDVWGL